MADNLSELPCSGTTIEPDLLIPETDYQECDTCAQADEKPEGDVMSDDEINAFQDELNAIAEQSAKEDEDFAKSMDSCVASLNKKVAEIKAEADSVMRGAEAMAKLDELLDNLEPFEYYYNSKIEILKLRKANLLNEHASKSEMLDALKSVDTYASMYSSAITLKTDFSIDPLWEPGSSNLNSYGLRYKHRVFLRTSASVNMAESLESFGILQYEDIAPEENTYGALYVEYYNKLDDPLNKLFSPEERGLTSDPAGIDPALAKAAANSTASLTDMATAKQGELSLFVKNQEAFNGFFANFQERYDTRVAEIRAARITPVLRVLKNALYKIALYEVELSGDSGMSEIVMAYVGKIRAERDRLKATYDAFVAKTKVDQTNPMSNEMVRGMMDDAKCLGGEAVTKEMLESPEQLPEQADVAPKDTFEYGPNGMSPTSPNPTKLCYWLKFAKHATTVGLIPVPDTMPKGPGQGLRYWPVGIVIPTPAALIKIPLPIVWIPLLVVNSKFGVIVMFLGMNGILPCPYMFFASVTGKKSFPITMRGPSDEFGYLPDDSDIGFPIKIRLPFVSLLQGLPEYMQALFAKLMGGKGFPPFDEFISDIEKHIFVALDNIGLPVFDEINKIKQKMLDGIVSIDEIYMAIEKDLSTWIDQLKLPKVTIPKDPTRSLQLIAALDAVKKIIEYYSMGFSLKLSGGLKAKIMDKINELVNDPDLRMEINLLPKFLDLSADEDWQKFKKFMGKTVDTLSKMFIPQPWDPTKTYYPGQRVDRAGTTYASIRGGNINNVPGKMSSWWFETDDLLKGSLMTPEINISNPLSCKDILSIPSVDLAFLAAISAAFSTIRGLISNLAAIDVIKILGFAKFKTDSILILIYELFNKIIPAIPLPSELAANAKKAYKKIIKDLSAISALKLDITGLTPSIKLDLNIVKQPIKNMIIAGMRESLALLPINVLSNLVDGFPALTAIELKVIVRGMIEAGISVIAEPVRVPYEAASTVYGAAKIIGGKSKTVMDSTMTPVEVAKAKAKLAAKKIADKLKTCLDDTYTIPPELLVKAQMVLEEFAVIPPIAVVAVPAFGGPIACKVLRLTHPLLYEDDLPPWERLNLKNLLFVLFMDEFCHVAKQQGGLFENYLP